MKLAANSLDVKLTANIVSLWMAAGVLVILPFYHHLLFIDGKPFYLMPALMAGAITKGILIHYSFRPVQRLRKCSQSSAIFAMPIAMGIAAVIDNLLFDEALSTVQLVGVVGVCLTGLVFFLFGHARELDGTGRKNFVLSILVITAMIITDYLTISRGNWYIYMFTYAMTATTVALLMRMPLKDWKYGFTHKYALLAGFAWCVTEIYFISVMVAVLPVSIAILSAQMMLPVLMVLSALIWKERSWQEQFIFGCIVFAAGLLILYNG